MKGQSHLVIASEPLNWLIAPPIMYGLCSAEVQSPEPLDTWADGKLPDFDSLKLCGKCLARLEEKRRFHDEDEHGDSAPVRMYIYAIGDKRDRHAHEMQHSGETISNLERTVTQVSGGLSKTSAPVNGGKQ